MTEHEPKRKKRSRDPNRLAYEIVQESIGEAPPPAPEPVKDQAAVELGRRGGLKGGRARATKLTAERRAEIAREAAKSRWLKAASSRPSEDEDEAGT